jgi:hypothetical protein
MKLCLIVLNKETSQMGDMRCPLLVLCLVPKCGKQQPLVDESPTNELYEPLPVEELRIYCRCQKCKAIPDATCRTSDLDLANSTSTLDLNSSILVIDDMNFPVARCKGVRSCTQHPISKFVFVKVLIK